LRAAIFAAPDRLCCIFWA